MNKTTNMINILFSLIRQYWKYKNHDLGMRFATTVLSIGATCLLSGGIWKLLISFEIYNTPVSISFNDENLSVIGILLIITGISIAVWRLNTNDKILTGILITHRGMQGMDFSHSVNVLPKSFTKGKFEIIDLHEGHQLHEGSVLSPSRALNVINSLDFQITSRLNGRDISKVKLAYAGLAPIPLLMVAGFKITSRQNCLSLDYQRNKGWHSLDDIDDLEELLIQKPTDKITKEISIILSFSIEISSSQLPDHLISKSYIFRLKNGARPDSLNSYDKQIRIAQGFYTLCANLKAKHNDMEEIHLFLASQASFAFRLGTMITASVMPKISIYQYNSKKGKYDWGVSFTNGKQPEITSQPN